MQLVSAYLNLVHRIPSEESPGQYLAGLHEFYPLHEKKGRGNCRQKSRLEVSYAASNTCQVWYSLWVSYVRGLSPESRLTFLEAIPRLINLKVITSHYLRAHVSVLLIQMARMGKVYSACYECCVGDQLTGLDR